MVNGYVTIEELMMITGLSAKKLRALLRDGMIMSEIDYQPLACGRNAINETLFNYKQVERWISLHIF